MTDSLYVEGCDSEDLSLAVRRLTLGRMLSEYHASKSPACSPAGAHAEDEAMTEEHPEAGLECLTCDAFVGDDGSCWCTCLNAVGLIQGEHESPMLAVAVVETEDEFEDESGDESSFYESSVSGSELYFGLADAESYDSSESGWLPEDYGIAINEINEANQADEDEDFYDAPACALCGCDESEMMWLDDKFVTCCECVG